MNEDHVDRMIKDYLNSIARILPDSFETDDMLEEIRAHILESLSDKVANHPATDRVELAQDVLDSLGDPEDIATEWGKAQYPDDDEEDGESKLLRIVLKQIVALVVIVVAAWFISTLPDSIVDFWTAFGVLLIFMVAEYFLRSWQKSESSRIEADVERKR
ncbi:MAG: hypothetical protein KAQ65_00910 [Candidatus Thorarchaeota archaeon]|nr:hypothetical protein [Candidatus Thorarchaeota archaeon]